jgi:hypothetical protein
LIEPNELRNGSWIQLRTKLGVALRHFAEEGRGISGLILKAHGDPPHIKRQRDSVALGRLRRIRLEHTGCAKRGVPGKRQFLLRGEDAHAHSFGFLDCRRPALDEGGFAQVEFAGDRLHSLRWQTNGIRHNRNRIACKGGGREHIGD